MNSHSHYTFFNRFTKTITSLLIISLFFSLFASYSIALEVNLTKHVDLETGRYIVQFNDEPLSIFDSNFRENLKNLFFTQNENFINNLYKQKILEYKDKLTTLHEKAKEDILKIINDKSEDIFSADFKDVFNGFVIKKMPKNLLSKIQDLPYIKTITPDYKFSICLDRSVSLINADDVWQLTDDYGQNITGKAITISILDTGVDYNHPDLKDNYLGGHDFANDDYDPMDDNGHGTHCAGIAIGKGNASNYKYVGVAPDAQYYAYKVLDEEGNGYASCFIGAIERSLDPNNDGIYSDHVDIISISSGNPDGNPDDTVSQAVDNAVKFGVVVIAAAGNEGYNNNEYRFESIMSPGCARKAICVGSSYAVYPYSVYTTSSKGPTSIGTVKPDVVAPGVMIRSTRSSGSSIGLPLDEYYMILSGTSMACPHVSGTAALILQKHPTWNPDEIKMALRNTATNLDEDIRIQGWGRIDTFDAVTLAEAPPIAILNTSGVIEKGVVDIFGTATSDDFQNYTVYYETNGNWEKLSKNNEKINNDVLFSWGTNSLVNGTYKLKLEVKSTTQTSTDIVFITIGKQEPPDQIFSIYEGESFRVNITENNNLINAWIILRVPYHFPRIYYGSSATFRAPMIINPSVESRDGEIIIFKIFGGYGTTRMDIRILNK